MDTYIQQSMPQAVPVKNRRRKILVIILVVILLLDAGFAAYWFYFRKPTLTDQDKINILENLKQNSTANFSPDEKNAIVNNLAAQKSPATSLSDQQKLDLLNAVGGGAQTTQ